MLLINYTLSRFRIEHHGGMSFVHIPIWGTWKLVVMYCVSRKY